MRILDVIFWSIMLWAVADSLSRWFRRRHAPDVIHAYIPVHYIGAALGVTCWALQIGNVDYDKGRLEWLRITGVFMTLGGWIMTFAGRHALGRSWTPDVVRISPESRVQSGLYARLKHPIYAGEAVLFLGMSLYLGSVPTFVLLFIGGTVYNVYRAKVEQAKANE
jgi:protein-S-isoprenylcysteine O-methyltransferase Ste14